MTRRELLSLTTIVLLAVATAHVLKNTRPLGRTVGASPSALRVLEDRESPQIAFGHADLAVVVFTDYQCPACRKADPALRGAIARDGKLRVVYRDWPIFGERSERAAKVALAGHHQGIYYSLHHRLMRIPSFDDAALRDAVEVAGGDWSQLQADLHTHGPAITNQLLANSRDAFSLGLRGTPGYLIGRFLIEGALTESEFLLAFDQARAAG
jgi:protein-disulfide isomerase